MQSAVPELVDVKGESRATQKMYGLEEKYGPTRIFARECLIARRLIERGARFVELTCPSVGTDRWDQHSGLRAGHEKNCRAVDQPIAGLLKDLKARVAASPNFFLTDYRGLTVGELRTLRVALRKSSGEYAIVKNTLFGKAIGDERLTKVPKDLDLKPYRDEHDDDLLRRMLASVKAGRAPKGLHVRDLAEAITQLRHRVRRHGALGARRMAAPSRAKK